MHKIDPGMITAAIATGLSTEKHHLYAASAVARHYNRGQVPSERDQAIRMAEDRREQKRLRRLSSKGNNS